MNENLNFPKLTGNSSVERSNQNLDKLRLRCVTKLWSLVLESMQTGKISDLNLKSRKKIIDLMNKSGLINKTLNLNTLPNVSQYKITKLAPLHPVLGSRLANHVEIKECQAIGTWSLH